MVERGWRAHVHGDGRRFASAREAIETFRGEEPGIGDQNLPGFVVAEGAEPVGRITSGDSVVCFNFRGDRAIEISRAFDDGDDFDRFDRGRRPDVLYAGMMEYDGDTHVPASYLVEPPDIEDTMGEYLAAAGVPQLAISETQKYGHVTYFWNGNRSGQFDPARERYIEIPSDNVPFEQRPWMKAAEITDRLIAELRTGEHRFARVNYANGDMVGHSGAFDATVIAVEVLDLQLRRLLDVVRQQGGIALVTADHGNADEMYQRDKQGRVVRDRETGKPVVKTSHTLSPVPFMIYDPRSRGGYRFAADLPDAGIANVTATCVELLGYQPPAEWERSLLTFT
jgi:2,3-bisphosphoglycerate-independent phosphoglycerate mutase